MLLRLIADRRSILTFLGLCQISKWPFLRVNYDHQKMIKKIYGDRDRSIVGRIKSVEETASPLKKRSSPHNQKGIEALVNATKT